MYFYDMDEEELEITEQVLKSYGVHYTVEKRKEPINKFSYYISYYIKADVSVEFYEYLKHEIDSKVIDFKFKQAQEETKQAQIKADKKKLEECLNIKYTGKNIDEDKKSMEDKIEETTLRQEALRKDSTKRFINRLKSIAKTEKPLKDCIRRELEQDLQNKPIKGAWQKTFEPGQEIDLPDDVPDFLKQMIYDLKEKGQGADIQIIEIKKDSPDHMDFPFNF